MKILVVSNLYPPYYIGGYEIGCQNFVNYIQKNTNNSTLVLTSNYGNPQIEEKNIERNLLTSWSYSKKSRFFVYIKNWYREIQNRKIFLNTLNNFKPDKIVFWNMTGISLNMTRIAEKEKIPYCIYAFDEQFSRLDEDFYTRQVRKVFKNFVPNIENIIFASKFLKKSFLLSRKKNIKPKNNLVINWGVLTQSKRKLLLSKKKINILYIGQIVKHKGLDILLKAIGLLDNKILNQINLNIFGGIHDKDFFLQNSKFIIKNKLQNIIKFNKKFKREDLKKIMIKHEILIFPSTWQEPFAISLLEAQSFGLAIIASDTGGTRESLSNGQAGILFKNKHYVELSKIIEKLIIKQSLINKYSHAAQNNIKKKYNFSITAKKILNFIKKI